MEPTIQSREDWLRWRKNGLGGSDMPIVLGLSPWSTPLKLYEEKLNPEVNEISNYQSYLGNEAEPKIRALLELVKGKSFSPALCQMADFKYMLSSLDGRSEDKKEIIELKLSGKEDWETTKSGKVPDKYFPQCQHNMLVSGADTCIFASYLFSAYEKNRRGPMSIEFLAQIEVKADKEYQSMLLREGTRFWDHVMSKKPPLPSDKDYKALVGLSKEAKKWLSNREKIEKLEEEQEVLRKQLLEAAERQGHSRFLCAGIRMSQVSRVGNVQYAKIPELKGVDLDKYRAAGSVYWKMEPVESNKK